MKIENIKLFSNNFFASLLFPIASFFSMESLYAASNPRKLYIIIHGTWGHESSWYLPEGDFFKTLEAETQNKDIKITSFTWSGRNEHVRRILAGTQLRKLIQSYSPKTQIYLITHSHGGTVASIASHQLAHDKQNKHKIKGLITLGTPIDVAREHYLPNMTIINKVINIISFNDFVQTVLGHCSREYPSSPHCYNLRILINGIEPNHSDLHSSIIARWIPQIIHDLIDFPNPKVVQRFKNPTIINFMQDTPPAFLPDPWRSILLKIDRGVLDLRGTGTNSSWSAFFNVLLTNGRTRKVQLTTATRQLWDWKNIKEKTKKVFSKNFLLSLLPTLYD